MERTLAHLAITGIEHGPAPVRAIGVVHYKMIRLQRVADAQANLSNYTDGVSGVFQVQGDPQGIPFVIAKAAMVAGQPSLLFSSKGEVIGQSFLYPKAPFPWDFYEGAMANPEPPRAGLYLFLDGLWSNLFWHWMLEYIPRVILSESLRPYCVISSSAPPFVRESLGILGVPAERILARNSATHYVEEALVIEPITGTEGHGRMSLSAYPNLVMEIRRRFALEEFKGGDSVNGWLISRRKAPQGRSIINEGELIEALSQFGIQPVVLEELTLKQQLSLFSSARIIAGPHGAGLVHALFMQQGSGVIELRSTLCPSGTNRFWMDLLGHRQREIVSPTPVKEMSDSFLINPEDLLKAVQEFV